jgi:hypothetical protein
MVLKYHHYPKEYRFWQQEQPLWGTYVALVDGSSGLTKASNKQDDDKEEEMILQVDLKLQETTSQGRRRRRRRVKERMMQKQVSTE